jgi:hypothetical protein
LKTEKIFKEKNRFKVNKNANLNFFASLNLALGLVIENFLIKKKLKKFLAIYGVFTIIKDVTFRERSSKK